MAKNQSDWTSKSVSTITQYTNNTTTTNRCVVYSSMISIFSLALFEKKCTHSFMQPRAISTKLHCIHTLDVLCFFIWTFFHCYSTSKDASESPISNAYFNFALLSLWNLLSFFLIWCRLYSLSWAFGLSKNVTRRFYNNSREESKYVLYLGDFSASF